MSRAAAETNCRGGLISYLQVGVCHFLKVEVIDASSMTEVAGGALNSRIVAVVAKSCRPSHDCLVVVDIRIIVSIQPHCHSPCR